MVKNPELTTISILKATRERLSKQMKHGQTYDDYLNELINTHIIPVEHIIDTPKMEV